MTHGNRPTMTRFMVSLYYERGPCFLKGTILVLSGPVSLPASGIHTVRLPSRVRRERIGGLIDTSEFKFKKIGVVDLESL